MGTRAQPCKSSPQSDLHVNGSGIAGSEHSAMQQNACMLGPGNHHETSSTMNGSNRLGNEEILRYELGVLRREHRDLDDAIHALEESGRADQLRLRRLKKQKLALKDKIARLEDRLFPDIIA